jgi:acyl transferase domain-containing protein
VSRAEAAFLICPGRGSYAAAELGSLTRLAETLGSEGRDLLAELEALRAAHDPDGPSLGALDGEPAFRPGRHLLGRNASSLIFACAVLDARRAEHQTRPVCVAGNSLGFYTALVVAGALDLASGYRLVSTMARLQDVKTYGGQVLWTLIDDDWNLLPERRAVLEHVLHEVNSRGDGSLAGVSIWLGGHVVVAGSEAAMPALLAALPRVKVGSREFPFRLAHHGPFHTALLEPVARAARVELADLPFGRPNLPLIDGRGFVWSPLWAEPEALRDYTLGWQVTHTFDFTAAVRVGLLDFAADRRELLAPGTSLRAPVGHVEKWLAWPAPDTVTLPPAPASSPPPAP